MSKTGLFVRHKAKPGQRDSVKAVWEKYVKPRANSNANHEAYYFCYDNDDPDVICVFQLLSDENSLDQFMEGPWYPEYLEAVSEYVLEAPTLNTATPQWIKGEQV